MAVASGFRYSDEEWAQIYALLPRYIRPDSAALRKEIEEKVHLWQCTAPDVMAKRAAMCREILAAVSQLDAVIAKADADPVMVVREPKLQEGLSELRRDMEAWLGLAKPPRRKNKNLHRDRLLKWLIYIWEYCGGEARQAGVKPAKFPLFAS